MDSYGISPLAKAIGIAANVTILKKAYDNRFEKKVGYRPYKTPIKACAKLQWMQMQLPLADLKILEEFSGCLYNDIARAFNVPIELLNTVDHSVTNMPVRGISPLTKYLNPKKDENS